LAVAQKPRKASARRDPPPSALSYDDDCGQLKNADPNKHYVWAYKVGNQVGAYENRGYDIELNRPDGPRAAVQRKDKKIDAPVEWNDCILMSVDLAIHEEIVAAGQRKVDAIERRLIDQEGAPDESRGIGRNRYGRPIVEMVNETGAAEQEPG
jgi:hypothetical protein